MIYKADTAPNDNRTTWKSAPFQARTNSESLSVSLQAGLRFLHDPLPALSTVFLAVHLPVSDRREIGLTTFPAIPTRYKYRSRLAT